MVNLNHVKRTLLACWNICSRIGIPGCYGQWTIRMNDGPPPINSATQFDSQEFSIAYIIVLLHQGECLRKEGKWMESGGLPLLLCNKCTKVSCWGIYFHNEWFVTIWMHKEWGDVKAFLSFWNAWVASGDQERDMDLRSDINREVMVMLLRIKW